MVDIQDFYSAAPIDTSRLIPNQLFQTWKTSIFDDGHAALLREFRNHNSEISFRFYDDKKMNAYMENRWGNHPIFKIFANTKVGAARADIWRYCILFDQGGFYLDIDSLILFKLIEVPPDFSELLGYENNLISRELNLNEYSQYRDMFGDEQTVRPKLRYPDNIVLNWAMMFRKGHPVLENAINFIVDNAPRFMNITQPHMLNAVLHFTGPLVLTYSVWKYLEIGNILEQSGIDFGGGAVFKAYMGGVYAEAEHYSSMNQKILFG